MATTVHVLAKRCGWIGATLVSVIGCDQVTKDFATETLKSAPPISLWGNFIRFQYAENHGAMLSFGAGLSPGLRTVAFTLGVGAFLAAVLGYLLLKRGLKVFEVVGWSLVLGGGLGNLIDRVANQGAVVDFVSVSWGYLRTGIFNLADVVIFFGIGFLLWSARPRVVSSRV